MGYRLYSMWKKFIKSIRLFVMGIFRQRITHPGENALGLILIFHTLVFQFKFLSTTDNRFVFENNHLMLFAQYAAIYALPALSLLNSRLFQERWKAILSTVASFLILCFMLIWSSFSSMFSHLELIRQTSTLEGQTIALYERKDFAVTPGDGTFYCRYHIPQSRVFPGILKNEDRLEKEACYSSRSSLPPDLK
jgi:signal transduction histidine kinase